MDDTKTCTKCGETYSATKEFFYVDRSKRSGLRPICKPCAREVKRAYDELHRKPKPIRDYKQADVLYRKCDCCTSAKPLTSEFFSVEKLLSGNTFLRNVCRTCRNLNSRERYSDYYASNKERIAKERKQRYESDLAYRERILLSNARWGASKRGREINRLSRIKRYWSSPEQHRALARVHVSIRRARKSAAGGKHTEDDIRCQYLSQKGLCWWCEAPVNEEFHVDHRIPIAKGGGSEPGNLVIACAQCNLKKGSKLPYQFCGRLL